MATETPKGVVLYPDTMKAYERGGGAKTIPLVGPRIGAKSFLNGMTIFGPGAAIPLHTHNCEESVLLLEGSAIAEIDGERHHIKAGDISWIPAEVPHRFINASQTEGMKILWIYARTDATRTLVETGETRPVLAEHVD
ncbi:cupin domain-containing protein [Muricoccus radiodurans]|uniref:cupin domain-containing protein n=1 Tax=Muricoccus radiodurans TaxID=2231721 RepID=UPI003CEEF058